MRNAGADAMGGAYGKPVLFDCFPDIDGRIPWLSLGHYPTPVQKLTGLGHEHLWIKRDDLSSPVYGGNKVRKLEFVLADVLKKGKKRVVTIGGIGTNHGLATAIFCRRLGLGCTLIVFDQPVTRHVRQNLLLFHKFGADLVYARNIWEAGVQFSIIQRMTKPGAYFLYAGGSSPLGTLGFVNAAFELKRQIEAGVVPSPRYLFCPLGSNGTMAGLSLGALLAGLDTTVIGIRVTKPNLGPMELATAGTVKALMGKTYRIMKSAYPKIREVSFIKPLVLENYYGGEYGLPTTEGTAAMSLFREKDGIKLEPTYTAKTCAGILDFIKDPSLAKDPILYWHTYNSVDLSKEAESVDYRELPGEFHKFFLGEPIL